MNKEHEDRWLEDLLGTPDIDDVLDKLAWAVFHEAEKRKLPLDFLGYKLSWFDVYGKTPDAAGPSAPAPTESEGPPPKSLREEIVDAIKAELVLFLHENQSKINADGPDSPDNADVIMQKAKDIKLRFISRWAGNTRRLDSDRYRYLYKRFREVLYASDQFITRAPGGRYTEYALDENSMPIHELSAEDLNKIPYPDGWAGTYDETNKKKNILMLAEHFRRNVSDMYGGTPVWIKVRDALNWLSAHISFQQPETMGLDDEESPASDGLEDYRHTPDAALFKKTVQNYAALFYERMSEKERFVFYEHKYAGTILEDIADMMGLKNASGPSYYYKNARDKLLYFLRDLDGLSPEDKDNEAAQLFLGALKKILKNNRPTPLSINKDQNK